MAPTLGYVFVSGLLFAIGVWGLLQARNGIKILICVEILLNSANLNLVAFAGLWADRNGYLYALFSIALAAAEAAVGLSILVALFRRMRTIDMRELRRLRR